MAPEPENKSAFDSSVRNAEIKIGGASFVLKPVKLKGLKQLIEIINRGLREFAEVGETNPVEGVSAVAFSRAKEILHVLFPESEYKAMTDDFIEESIDFPTLRHIFTMTLEVNHLIDLYPSLRKFVPSKEAPPSKATGD